MIAICVAMTTRPQEKNCVREDRRGMRVVLLLLLFLAFSIRGDDLLSLPESEGGGTPLRLGEKHALTSLGPVIGDRHILIQFIL